MGFPILPFHIFLRHTCLTCIPKIVKTTYLQPLNEIKTATRTTSSTRIHTPKYVLCYGRRFMTSLSPSL